MCQSVAEKNTCHLDHVLDKYKTEEMYMKAVCIELKLFQTVFFNNLMKQGIRCVTE